MNVQQILILVTITQTVLIQRGVSHVSVYQGMMEMASHVKSVRIIMLHPGAWIK